MLVYNIISVVVPVLLITLVSCLFIFQSGLTALHLAAQEDKVHVAEMLVKQGANVDQQTKVSEILQSSHFKNNINLI